MSRAFTLFPLVFVCKLVTLRSPDYALATLISNVGDVCLPCPLHPPFFQASYVVREQVKRDIREGCPHTSFKKISLLILNTDSEALGHGNLRDIVNWKKSLNDRLCLKAVVLFFFFLKGK